MSDEIAPTTPSETLVDPFSGEVLIFDERPDSEVVDAYDQIASEYERIRTAYDNLFAQVKSILEKRMRERGAKSIPHPSFEEIALVPQYSGYVFDVAKLAEAATFLKPASAAKVIRHVTEHTIPAQVIPAHDEPGNPVSINAIIKNNAGSEAAELLAEGCRRDYLGDKIVIKRAKPALKRVDPIITAPVTAEAAE